MGRRYRAAPDLTTPVRDRRLHARCACPGWARQVRREVVACRSWPAPRAPSLVERHPRVRRLRRRGTGSVRGRRRPPGSCGSCVGGDDWGVGVQACRENWSGANVCMGRRTRRHGPGHAGRTKSPNETDCEYAVPSMRTNATTRGIGKTCCEGQASELATGFGLTVLRGKPHAIPLTLPANSRDGAQQTPVAAGLTLEDPRTKDASKVQRVSHGESVRASRSRSRAAGLRWNRRTSLPGDGPRRSADG